MYRGRIAPSPTGYLHLGHARTFWVAQHRARAQRGVLVLRIEDLDRARCRPRFVEAITEDLRWFGIEWQEGPDRPGGFAPYVQSERQALYRSALSSLRQSGWVYPCTCSRREIALATSAPHPGDEEPLYPGTCRHRGAQVPEGSAGHVNWRFRVPEGEPVRFDDGWHGPQTFVGGRDFGDFIVWRHDDLAAYQLAVVVDDAAMRITEVVRGADLLLSTARQLLLYRALGLPAPQFFHCPLVTDDRGARLAKRHDALSLWHLRQTGADPGRLRETFRRDLRMERADAG